MLGKLDQTLALTARRLIIQPIRNYPARGTKPKPRYLWNMLHLQEITGGEYTHQPLQVHRLGGRHPDTGRKVNQHIGGGYKFDYFMIDFHSTEFFSS